MASSAGDRSWWTSDGQRTSPASCWTTVAVVSAVDSGSWRISDGRRSSPIPCLSRESRICYSKFSLKSLNLSNEFSVDMLCEIAVREFSTCLPLIAQCAQPVAHGDCLLAGKIWKTVLSMRKKNCFSQTASKVVAGSGIGEQSTPSRSPFKPEAVRDCSMSRARSLPLGLVANICLSFHLPQPIETGLKAVDYLL
jgi:hypothetical protein